MQLGDLKPRTWRNEGSSRPNASPTLRTPNPTRLPTRLENPTIWRRGKCAAQLHTIMADNEEDIIVPPAINAIEEREQENLKSDLKTLLIKATMPLSEDEKIRGISEEKVDPKYFKVRPGSACSTRGWRHRFFLLSPFWHAFYCSVCTKLIFSGWLLTISRSLRSDSSRFFAPALTSRAPSVDLGPHFTLLNSSKMIQLNHLNHPTL